MPTYTANDGVVLVDTNAVGFVRSWEHNENADEIDTPYMGASARVRLPGKPDVSGTVTAWFDDADTAQSALDVADSVDLQIRPRGTGSGLPEIQCSTARILSVNHRGAVDGGIEIEFGYVSDAVADMTAQT